MSYVHILECVEKSNTHAIRLFGEYTVFSTLRRAYLLEVLRALQPAPAGHDALGALELRLVAGLAQDLGKHGERVSVTRTPLNTS